MSSGSGASLGGKVALWIGVSIAAKATGSAHLTAWTPDTQEGSLEQRVQAVVENLDRLRSAQSKQDTELRKLKDSHESHRKEVAENTERLEKTLRSDLESLHTADLLTSLVGLGWLTSGIFLSTLAPELYCWL